MKSSQALVLALLFSLMPWACTSLPAIVPDQSVPGPARPDRDLDQLFPQKSFQFVHSLELTFPGNHSALLMGIVNVRPRTRDIHCVIMTVEGLVLFEADFNNDILTVERGIPPFDAREFALGLIRDIRMIFFNPPGPLLESGRDPDQQRIYRFSGSDSRITDVIVSPDRSLWTLNAHDSNLRITRTIRYRFASPESRLPESRFPLTITLTARGSSGYTLTMTLIDAHPITDPIDPGDTP